MRSLLGAPCFPLPLPENEPRWLFFLRKMPSANPDELPAIKNNTFVKKTGGTSSFYKANVSNNFLNPNFLREQVADPGQAGKRRDRIYSTLDSLVLAPVSGSRYERVSEENHLTVQALSVTLVGTLRVPRGDVKIYCRTLVVAPPPSDADNQPGATIDVSAAELAAPYDQPSKPATPRAADGADGADGEKMLPDGKLFGQQGDAGGSIDIVCEVLVCNGRLALRANGGKGYPGGNGQDGGVATGGHAGGRGGRAGPGGNGGSAGSIRVRCKKIVNESGTPLDWDWLECECEGGAPGQAGEPGTGPAGPGGPAASNNWGKSSDEELDDGWPLSALGNLFDDIFLLKLLKKAQFMYLSCEPSGHAEGVPTYFPPGWAALSDLLEFSKGVLEDFMGLRAQVAPDDTANSHRKAFGKEVGALYDRCFNPKGALTYDGHATNWVPSEPLSSMIQRFKDHLGVWTQLQQAYMDLAQDYGNKKNAQKVATKALGALRQQVQAASSDYQTAQLGMLQLRAELVAADDELIKMQKALVEPIKAMIHVVETFVDCVPDRIFSALGQMAFVAGPGHGPQMAIMGAIQGAELIYNSLSKITTPDGKSFDKRYLVGEIKELGELSAGTLPSTIRNELVGADGTLDPTAKLLVTKLSTFKDEIDSLKAKLDAKMVKDVDHAIDAFIAALDHKGSLQVAYNRGMLNMVTLYDRWETAEATYKEKNALQDPLSVYDTRSLSYLGALYQEQLDRVAGAVAMIRRKQAYVMLNSPEARRVEAVSALNGIWIEGAAPADNTIEAFSTQVMDIADQVQGYRSGQSSAPRPIPEDKNQRGNVHIDISGDDLRKSTKSHGSLTFTTVDDPALHKPGAGIYFVNDSATQWDCRVTHVCPRVFGAKTASGNVLVRIRAGLSSAIRNDTGSRFRFTTTNPRYCEFEHLANTLPGDPTNKDSGQGKVGKLNDNDLDSLGLCTTWVLDLPPATLAGDTNEGLDLSEVSFVRVYFRIVSRTRPR